MPTDIIQSLTSIVQTIVVIISLWYVSKQARDAAKAIKGQTYQSIISAYAEIESRIAQDSEMANIYNIGRHIPEQLSPIDKIRFEQFMCSIFNFFENLYYQNENGLLDEHLWSGWHKLMESNLKETGFQDYWKDHSYFYSERFSKYIESVIGGSILKNKKISRNR
jgi:hypothetical protein